MLGTTREIVVALDWTTFDADGHSTVALSLVTRHGRATPLVWKRPPRTARRSSRRWASRCVTRLTELVATTVAPAITRTVLRPSPPPDPATSTLDTLDGAAPASGAGTLD